MKLIFLKFIKLKIKFIVSIIDRKFSWKIYKLFRVLSGFIISRKKTPRQFVFDLKKDENKAINFLKKYGYLKFKSFSKSDFERLDNLSINQFLKKSIIIPSTYSYHYDDLLRLAKTNKLSIIDRRGDLPKEMFKGRT